MADTNPESEGTQRSGTSQKTVTKPAAKKVSAKKYPTKKARTQKTNAQRQHGTPATLGVNPSPPTGRRRAGVVGWMGFLFGLGALAGTAYNWYENERIDTARTQQFTRFSDGVNTQINARLDNQQSRAEIDAQLNAQIDARITAQVDPQVNRLRERLSRQEQQEQELKAQTAELQDEARAERESARVDAQAQRDKLRQEMGVLSDELVRIRSDWVSSIDGWSVEEVERLLWIANERLRIAADIELATDALQLAYKRLLQLSNPAFEPVLERIADEIVALQSVKPVDVAGTLEALADLSRGVRGLVPVGMVPLYGVQATYSARPIPEPPSKQPAAQETKRADETTFWGWLKNLGGDMVDDLDGLVRIETKDTPRRSRESLELGKLRYQKTKLMLEIAKTAFMLGKGDAYRAQMDAIDYWVGGVFITRVERFDTWQRRLNELAKVSPTVVVPDISGSLKALRRVVESTQN